MLYISVQHIVSTQTLPSGIDNYMYQTWLESGIQESGWQWTCASVLRPFINCILFSGYCAVIYGTQLIHGMCTTKVSTAHQNDLVCVQQKSALPIEMTCQPHAKNWWLTDTATAWTWNCPLSSDIPYINCAAKGNVHMRSIAEPKMVIKSWQTMLDSGFNDWQA